MWLPDDVQESESKVQLDNFANVIVTVKDLILGHVTEDLKFGP
jgi:hypothetical protein